MLFGQPVRQIAYYVNDVREAALRHSALFASGPFFAIDYPALPVLHRGKSAFFEHSAAIGQWGSIQVELMQDNGGGPSILGDLYEKGSGRTGIHHMAIIVDDLEGAVTSFKKSGYSEAMRVSIPHARLNVVFMDTVATHGHFMELYEPVQAITNMYDAIAKAAIGFDGRNPLHEAHVDPDTFALHVKSRH
jgi:Glyoxalase/Bleomycin resistance protein/Dioxygenase superfamily